MICASRRRDAGVLAHQGIERVSGDTTTISDAQPSLMQGSAQRVKIGRFKTNPKDQCIGMSILIVKAKLNSEVLVTFYILTLL